MLNAASAGEGRIERHDAIHRVVVHPRALAPEKGWAAGRSRRMVFGSRKKGEPRPAARACEAGGRERGRVPWPGGRVPSGVGGKRAAMTARTDTRLPRFADSPRRALRKDWRKARAF